MSTVAEPFTTPAPAHLSRAARFDHAKIRASVIELASKTKEKKRLRRSHLATWRADRANDEARHGFEEQHTKALERGDCARAWGLAYAFVRGRFYRTVEQTTRTPLDYLSLRITDCLLEVSELPPEARKLFGPAYNAVRDEVTLWLKTEIHSPGPGNLMDGYSPAVAAAVDAFLRQ